MWRLVKATPWASSQARALRQVEHLGYSMNRTSMVFSSFYSAFAVVRAKRDSTALKQAG